MKKTKLVVMLLFVGIFILGIGTGYIGALYFSVPQTAEVQPAVDYSPTDETRPASRPNPRMRQWMIHELSLTEEQQDPFFDLLQQMRSESWGLFQQSRIELEQKMCANNQLFMQALAEVLNEEQLALFEARFSRQALQRNRQQGSMRQRRMGGGAQPRHR